MATSVAVGTGVLPGAVVSVGSAVAVGMAVGVATAVTLGGGVKSRQSEPRWINGRKIRLAPEGMGSRAFIVGLGVSVAGPCTLVGMAVDVVGRGIPVAGTAVGVLV